MTPHLEKIARAIYDEETAMIGDYIITAETWETTKRRPGYYRIARAALSALLPPSEEMVEAMRWHTYDPGFPEQAIKAFTAAIQSILTEGEGA